jgi:hypothetical protein
MSSSPNNDDIILTSINDGSESNVNDTQKKKLKSQVQVIFTKDLFTQGNCFHVSWITSTQGNF